MAATTRPRPVPTAPGGRPTVRRVASTVVVAHAGGALLGAVTWLVAARALTPSTVGVGVALTGALGWCGLVANGGLGSAVVALVPGRDGADAAALVGTAARRATALGAGAGLAAVGLLGLVDGPLHRAGARPVVAAALVVGAAATSVSIVGDSAAVALGRPRLVVGRSLLFVLARLALLAAGLAVGADGRDVLVGGWAAATIVAVLGQGAALRTAVPRRSGPARRPVRFGAEAWANHLVSLAAQSPGLLLPVLVAAVAGPADAGAFGAAWQVASVAALASPSVATALFAHGSHDPAGLARAARGAGRDLLVVLVPVVVVVAVLGPFALGLLGSAYRTSGALALVLIALALLPDAVSNIAVGAWRARRRYRPAMALNGLIALTALGGAAALAGAHGATGAATSWLVAQALGATFVVLLVARPRRGHLWRSA